MYGQHSMISGTPALTGAAGASAGIAFGLPLGWLVLAVFVMVMAVWALLALLPRRRREVRKVNPEAASKMRLLTRVRKA